MSIEVGHYALILAFALATGQAIVGFGFWRRGVPIARFVRRAAYLQAVLIVVAFLSLVQAFVLSDFSLKLAFENSHSLQPMLFRVTSVWGNHEGSLILWVMILAIFGALVALSGRRLPTDLLTLVVATQGLLGAAFTGFSLFTSNAFARLDPAPFEGRDLNPVLQDFGLAVHPPMLYAGYVGFSVCFSFAIAALISGRIDAAWARWVRPWTLVSWVALTLGIAMGSYWAYYELGWGGWWFWDPVENASFMPWLAGTALLHSALVMEKRNALKIWTILLAIVTFSFSLLGTFLVRSGILTSVHSFASDPTRGLVILFLLAFFIGGAFILFASRASSLKSGGLFAPISREGMLILNNLFLATATAAVLVGTLYPLVLDALTGTLISVGAPFFDLTFGALMVPLLVILPFGPFMAWKRGDLVAVTERLAGAIAVSIFAVFVLFILMGARPSLAIFGLSLGIWVSVGALADLVERSRIGRIPVQQSVRRLQGLPRSIWSTALAHLGVGISVIGIVSASAWGTENITTLKPGEVAQLSGYSIEFLGEDRKAGPNYSTTQMRFGVSDPSGDTRPATSEMRIYTASRMPTSEAAITTFGVSQLYIATGEASEGGGRVVRIWFKPFILLIWLGPILMGLAGLVSLSDRRLRYGTPKASRRAAPEPAE